MVDADAVLTLTAAALGSVPIDELIVEGDTDNAGRAIYTCRRNSDSMSSSSAPTAEV